MIDFGCWNVNRARLARVVANLKQRPCVWFLNEVITPKVTDIVSLHGHNVYFEKTEDLKQRAVL